MASEINNWSDLLNPSSSIYTLGDYNGFDNGNNDINLNESRVYLRENWDSTSSSKAPNPGLSFTYDGQTGEKIYTHVYNYNYDNTIGIKDKITGVVIELFDISINLTKDPGYDVDICTNIINGFDASAVAVLDVSVDLINDANLFQIRVDSLDLEDNSSNDVLFAVHSRFADCFSNIDFSEAIVKAGNINQSYSLQHIKHDLIRSIAKDITGGYAAGDIFSNESQLVTDVYNRNSNIGTGLFNKFNKLKSYPEGVGEQYVRDDSGNIVYDDYGDPMEMHTHVYPSHISRAGTAWDNSDLSSGSIITEITNQILTNQTSTIHGKSYSNLTVYEISGNYIVYDNSQGFIGESDFLKQSNPRFYAAAGAIFNSTMTTSGHDVSHNQNYHKLFEDLSNCYGYRISNPDWWAAEEVTSWTYDYYNHQWTSTIYRRSTEDDGGDRPNNPFPIWFQHETIYKYAPLYLKPGDALGIKVNYNPASATAGLNAGTISPRSYKILLVMK